MEIDDDRAWLTPLLNRIADVVGLPAAIAIARARGGERITIPTSITTDTWLVSLIGREATAQMIAQFGGQTLEISPALIGEKRRRAENIRRLVKKGYSDGVIAHRLGVAMRTVRNHRETAGFSCRRDERQRDLFDN